VTYFGTFLRCRDDSCFRCRLSPSAITSTVSVSSISTVASKSKLPTTAHRRAESGAWCASSGMSCLCPRARSQDQPVVARARPPEARLVSHQARGSLQAYNPTHFATPVASGSRRRSYRRTLRCHPSPARRSRGAPYPQRPLLSQEVRRGFCRSGLCRRTGDESRGIPFRPPLSGTLAPSSTEFAAVDRLIRELVQYRDLINHRTKECKE
jgi:hypothetical protein